MHSQELIRAVLKEYHPTHALVDSTNQLLSNMKQIIENFKFSHRYTNNLKEDIIISYNMNDCQIQKPERNIIQCQSSREYDFCARFIFKMTFVIQCATDETVMQIPDSCLHFEIPIPTGCFLDPNQGKTTMQLWEEGSDLRPIPGDFNFKGTTYIIPSVWSFPFNKAIVVNSTQKYNQQVVRSEYIRQENPIHGNTFYTVYTIVQKKDVAQGHPIDIVCQFKQQHDGRFKSQKDCGYIPISILAHAYGIESDEQLLNLINPDGDSQITETMICMIRNGHMHKQYYGNSRDLTIRDDKGNVIKTAQQHAIEILGEHVLHDQYKHQIIQVLEKYIHPLNKNYLTILGEICRKLCIVYNDPTQADDKDDIVNKRVSSVATQLLAEMRSKLQVAFSKQMRAFSLPHINLSFKQLCVLDGLQKQLNTTASILSDAYTESIKKSFTTSNSSQNSDLKKVLNEEKTRHHDIVTKNEIVIRPKGQQKLQWGQRCVHPSGAGIIGAEQCPEAGAKVGLYISSAVFTYYSVARRTYDAEKYIKSHPLFLQDQQPKTMNICINSVPIGYVKWEGGQWKQFYNDLLKWKIQNSFITGQLTPGHATNDSFQLSCSVYYYIKDSIINYLTDSGRHVTFIIKGKYDGVSTFRQMVNSGKLMFACKMMQYNFTIHEYSSSNDPDKWYFLPYGMVSHFAAANPLIQYQKFVRACYATNQQKQAITTPFTNHMTRCTNSTLITNQVQHATVDTSFSRELYGDTSLVQNAYTGFVQWMYDQEDAIIVSAGYIYRGAHSSSSYRTYMSTCSTLRESFAPFEPNKDKPHNRLVNNKYNMACQMGQRIDYGDTLIHKIRTIHDQISDQTALTYDLNYPKKYSCVSNVIFESLRNRKRKLVRVHLSRYPIQGDKFASRNAQKGTLGKFVHEWEMPCDIYGRVLNFIVSCPSIIKRETLGQIAEPGLNNDLLESEEYTLNIGIDEPNTRRVHDISGEEGEYMFCPGGKFLDKIYAGSIGYNAQSHLVAQKMKSRDGGDCDKMSRQPISGHKKKSAMKHGTLEQNSLYASGACNMLVDQYGKNSSDTQYSICETCGRDQVYYQQLLKKWVCYYCKCDVQAKKGGRNYSSIMLSNIFWSTGAEQILEK